MTRYTLYLGLITRDNRPVKPSVRNAVLDDAVQTFGGYTVVPTTGGYRADNGFTIHEPSLRIEVITDADSLTIRDWAKRARLLANQESVILTQEPINAAHISDADESNNTVSDSFVGPQIGRGSSESLRV